MCLEVSISITKLASSGVGPERISDASGLVIAKGKNNLGSCLLVSGGGGCSCDLLSDQADFEKPSLELTESAVEKVAEAVRFVGKEARSFVFQSRWLGDSQHEPQRMTLSALLKAIRTNTVPKNTPILVGSQP
jgi:hypothetical protein